MQYFSRISDMVSLRENRIKRFADGGNAPEQIESESEDHNGAKNKIQRSGIRGPATRVLNSKARVIHSVGLPLAGSRGDTAFHDTATTIADSRIIDCGNGSCTSSECNDDYSSIFTRVGR